MEQDPTQYQVTGNLTRLVYGCGTRLAGLGPLNRRRFYNGDPGLRMVTLHETRGPAQMDRLKRLVDHCEARFDWGTPEDIAALCEGRFTPQTRTRLIFTFDDGHADNFEAASYLASRGLKALFFVIPAFLDRDVPTYDRFHRANGVKAFRFDRHHQQSRGLARSQVREMAAMGHLVGGHNYAHRDLGRLHEKADLDYEIGRALDDMAELLGAPCQDFAFGFGQPEHLSPEAYAYLDTRCARLYSSVRGLNRPGRSPRLLLRDPTNLWHPTAFTAAALDGALDHRAQDKWTALERLSGRLPEGSENQS